MVHSCQSYSNCSCILSQLHFIMQLYHLSMVLLNLFEMMDWINCPNSFCCQREERETPPSRCTFRSFRQESRRTAQRRRSVQASFEQSHDSSNKGLIGGGCIEVQCSFLVPADMRIHCVHTYMCTIPLYVCTYVHRESRKFSLIGNFK